MVGWLLSVVVVVAAVVVVVVVVAVGRLLCGWLNVRLLLAKLLVV